MEREIRGVPLWLIREYLEELGGAAVDEETVRASNWSARLEQIEDFQIGSLVVGQVRLTVEGEPAVLLELGPRIDEKLIRAGG